MVDEVKKAMDKAEAETGHTKALIQYLSTRFRHVKSTRRLYQNDETRQLRIPSRWNHSRLDDSTISTPYVSKRIGTSIAPATEQ